MSFSLEQKADAIAQPIKTSCCRKALLQGMLAARGSISDGMVFLSVSGEELIEYTADLIQEIYARTPEVANSSCGGRRRMIGFKSRSAEKYIAEFSHDEYCDDKCPMCQSAFLKGIFLASGRVTDPEKQYFLEFSILRSQEILLILESMGLNFKLTEKVKENVVYSKNSSVIEDFFAMANMNSIAFIIMNAKIKGELKNNTHRLVNCETHNIARAAAASAEQLAVIRELEEKELLSILPDELEATARFRLEHLDMSLSQMAGAITPPVSKSGLAHRFRRITAMAKSILADKDKKS